MPKDSTKSKTKSDTRRKEKSSQAKQSKNALILSMSHRERGASSNSRKSFKTLYDERMTATQASGLSSGFAPLEPTHSDTKFTPSRSTRRAKTGVHFITETSIGWHYDESFLDI